MRAFGFTHNLCSNVKDTRTHTHNRNQYGRGFHSAHILIVAFHLPILFVSATKENEFNWEIKALARAFYDYDVDDTELMDLMCLFFPSLSSKSICLCSDTRLAHTTITDNHTYSKQKVEFNFNTSFSENPFLIKAADHTESVTGHVLFGFFFLLTSGFNARTNLIFHTNSKVNIFWKYIRLFLTASESTK